MYGRGFGFGGGDGERGGVGERTRGAGGRGMTGDGGGRWEIDGEVEGRDRVERALVGEVGVIVGTVSPRCSTVGVKRLPARSAVGVKRGSGCGGDKRPVAGWMIPEGSEEARKGSGKDISLERRAKDGTRESFSSGEGKRGGRSSGGVGWRMCANEEDLTGGGGSWKEEEGGGEMSLRRAATVARRGAWAVGVVGLCGDVAAEVEGGG